MMNATGSDIMTFFNTDLAMLGDSWSPSFPEWVIIRQDVISISCLIGLELRHNFFIGTGSNFRNPVSCTGPFWRKLVPKSLLTLSLPQLKIAFALQAFESV